MPEKTHQIHRFEPVCKKDSKILILGSFPSVKSRENNFYYGHLQNRFWKVLANILACELPETIEQKKLMLLSNGIAIWDVISSCDISGSSDSSITNVIPADLSLILNKCNIEKIYANGNLAKQLYYKYSASAVGMDIIGLPSTSPANAAYSLERLIMAWRVILE